MSDNGRTSRGKLEANEFSGIGIQIELPFFKHFVVVTELRNKTASAQTWTSCATLVKILIVQNVKLIADQRHEKITRLQM